MPNLFKDIRDALKNRPNIYSLCGERIYYLQPIREQKEPFIIFKRQNETSSLVNTNEKIEITIFCEDTEDILTTCEEIKTAIKDFSIEKFFHTSFVACTDGSERLENGFIFSTLIFILQKT